MNVSAEQVKTIEDFEAFIAQPENADSLFEFIDGEIIEVSPAISAAKLVHIGSATTP